MPRFHQIGELGLRSFYSIDIEEEKDGTRVVYFNSSIHVNKRTRIGPGYGRGFTYEEILRDVMPYAIRQFGTDITYCPRCGC